VKELAQILGVSKSSISLWVRDIELSPEQRARLDARSLPKRLAGAKTNAARGLARRRAAQRLGRQQARSGDPLHLAGCMLFWAEGSRRRDGVEFVNSDPAMVAFFVQFLRSCYGVADSKIRVTCNLFADHGDRLRQVEDYWLDTLGLPRTSLRKSTVNRYSKYSRKKRSNKLPYGTCRISVCSTQLVQNLYGAIQEYGGFDREAWLM
jgi:hypothetical protein